MNCLKIKFWYKKKKYVMIELTFLKELTLMRQVNQKIAIFVTTDIFK